VDALSKLPHSEYAAAPTGQFGRDYNTLRKLALEALPGIDERLIGKYVTVRHLAGEHEVCDARIVEIETYARQIMEQLAAAGEQPAALSSHGTLPEEPALVRDKAYDVQAIRQEYNQAYAPWSDQDDAYLRSRFLERATIDDLVWEFGRQPGGIRSRLRKLGLDPEGIISASGASPGASHTIAQTELAKPSWRELRPRAGRVWTSEEDELLLREFEAGSPLEAIARSLGRGVFSVEVRLCKLGRASRSQSRA
jgi:hypothetical protein